MKPQILIGGAVLVATIALVTLVTRVAGPPVSRVQSDAIVKDYLATLKQAIGQILAEIIKHRPRGTATATGKATVDHSAAIAGNAAELFSSPHQVTLGDPGGDVTLVEFFDYNCGSCKRALSDMLTLINDDPHLKIVLKEFPILGPRSMEAARVAVAVRMQDPGGQKYLAFHRELLGSPMPASRERAIATAKSQGFDIARLERDMTSDEVAATLSEARNLAGALRFTGAPSYVIGKDVVFGTVGIAVLKEHIARARVADAR
jgi:protein-disulfide isomerase